MRSKSTPSLAATIPSRDTPSWLPSGHVSHHLAALEMLLPRSAESEPVGKGLGLRLEAAQVILVITVLVLVTPDNVSS